MKVYRPLYCKDFKCIAEKCQHSCCVGWEISVDETTLEKYEALGRDDILCHIKNGEIQLCEGGKCPFLTSCGLCRIISEFGDDYTSAICREHPRFYHKIGNRVEGGIGLACEEACRIILSSDLYREFYECEHTPEVSEETCFDGLSHRDFLLSLLSDSAMSFAEKKDCIRKKYSLETDIHTNDEWRQILLDLEYLEDEHRGLFVPGEGREKCSEIFERFLAYLIFRHVSVADSYDNARARVGFCLMLCSLLEGYTAIGEPTFADMCDFARIVSEEIEYSEDNTAELIFEFESLL